MEELKKGWETSPELLKLSLIAASNILIGIGLGLLIL